MSVLEKLSFSFAPPLPLILQDEATECGLACLAMVAGYHGYQIDLMSLRRRFPVSLKGATLHDIIHVAERLELSTRPLKLDLEHLNQLQLPCILHWNFNHFIVLKSAGSKKAVIHDPAQGIRTVSKAELSESFTGVALEAWPGSKFCEREERKVVKLRNLIGQVTGLSSSCLQVLMLALTLELFALVAPFFLQWVVDNALVSADRDLISTLAIGFGLLMLMQQVVGLLRSWVLMYFGTTLNLQWRSSVFSHLMRLPIQYFEKRHLGDVVSRFHSIDLIQRTLTTSFFEGILDGLMAVATLVLMFVYSKSLAAIAVSAMLAYVASRRAWYRPLRTATEEQIVHAARQQSHFLESVRGVKTIKLFQRQDDRRSSWLALLVDQINADLRVQRLQLFYKLLNGILFGLENIVVIWLGASLVLDGLFSVGLLIAFNAYKGQFDSRVSALIDKFYEIKMLRLQGERLSDIVMSPPESLGTARGIAENDVEPSISVRGLRYRYSDHEPFVLDGIDFSIAAGESVAIVGPSGCGKTTLMNILLGLLPPVEGEILLSGVPLWRFGVEKMRSIIGTVLQDDVLFAGSISDNISFFDPRADRKWVSKCAEMAAIASDIDAMPMGYNTLVGDMGTVLSGGQKQRILLARALYKKPRVLFLDEATSHLDVAKELEVSNAVKGLNMTRVIIAHRPETIASATRVIVLVAGKVVQDLPVPLVRRGSPAYS